MRKFTIFNGPYILIRDSTTKHKPFWKEYKGEKLPKLEYDGRLFGCPFLKEYDGTKPKVNKKKGAKPGFCELCYEKFSNYQKHVLEDTHIKNANEPYLFREVDEIISNFQDMDCKNSMLNMSPATSPTSHKSPDYYNGPSTFLSYMSKRSDAATTIEFVDRSSDINPNKKPKVSCENIDEFVKRLINDSEEK